MISVGIEAMNVFGGTAYVDVLQLAKHRQMDTSRFGGLLMKEKSVALPYEDPVSFGVNAAKPLIDSLSEEDKNSIELLITCTESGIDFGKSISTYIHHYLGLSRNCRMFEIKQACYSGTAGFQAAVNFILSGTSKGAKALVIATDISRFIIPAGEDIKGMDWSFVEPSSGAGAVALLVSDKPNVFRLDVGASGYYSYEEAGICRPVPDSEFGHTDTSLMSYLDCCEQTFKEYRKRVEGADYRETFNYLTFHTPFGGIVKSAHRTMMRRMAKATPDEIEKDFEKRVIPGMEYCSRTGNIGGATVFLALASTIDNEDLESSRRVGCFGFGSGCCSEFYSGIVTPESKKNQSKFKIASRLDKRYKLTIEEYEKVLKESNSVKFGTRNVKLDFDIIEGVKDSCKGNQRLFLEKICEFHREYRWGI